MLIHIYLFINFYSKADQELLPKVMHNLQLLLSDSSVAVQKRVIQSLTQLYKITLQWLARANSVSDLMQKTWQVKAKVSIPLLIALIIKLFPVF